MSGEHHHRCCHGEVAEVNRFVNLYCRERPNDVRMTSYPTGNDVLIDLTHIPQQRTESKQAAMPLVKLFARNTLQKAVPLRSLQSKLCDIWGTKPETTKLLLMRCEDWTEEKAFQEDIYVDIRAYGMCRRDASRQDG